MTILVVDDNLERTRTLVAHLLEHTKCRADEIDVATNGLAARDFLSRKIYELMVLDVILPFREKGDADAHTAMDLLTELSEGHTLRKPRHIIGITAFEAAEKSVAPEFTARSWVLVRQNSMNDDWLHTITSAVRYIENGNGRDERGFDVDLLVVTALQQEMEAIRSLPWHWSPDEALDDSQFFARGSFQSGGRSCSVIAAVASRMGMVSASILVSKLIKQFRPRLVAMPGLCAGLRERTKLGDVICADMSWDYQSGKQVTTAKALSGFQMEPHFIQADGFISARVDLLARDEEFSLSVWRGRDTRPAAPPVLRRGPVASGSAVLANLDVTESIKLQQRKLLAVEMELYGVFFAAEQAPRPKPIVLGIKGVCDFADDEKNDALQSYACWTSSAYLREFCERYLAELSG